MDSEAQSEDHYSGHSVTDIGLPMPLVNCIHHLSARSASSKSMEQ